MEKTIGVIGAKGFVGSHLMKRLKKESLNPIAYEHRLCEIEKLRGFVKKCDIIYHTAGMNRSDTVGTILRNNLIGTTNIILSMFLEKRYPRLVFVSSTQVEWAPATEFGLAKFLEEHAVKEVPKWCIFRTPNLYGPGCRPYYNSVVATFCHQIATGKEITLNDPNVVREFMYVGNFVGKLLKPEYGKILHVKGTQMTIEELVSFLTDKLGRRRLLKKTLDYYMKEAAR